MDNKVLFIEDIEYGIHRDGSSLFGKELLENEKVMNEFIKIYEQTVYLKEVHYYESTDGKRKFLTKPLAAQYELLYYTCEKIKAMEDKRAALVKLVRLCGDVITSYKNCDYTDIFYPIADVIEKEQHCAICCNAWRTLSDFQDTFPCLFSTYMHLAYLVLSEN